MESKMFFSFLLILLSLNYSSLFGQVEEQTTQTSQHPIDAEIANCYSRNPTTMGILECEIMGFNKWNKEMERLYDQLAARLDNDAKLILKDQQLAWMKYRDLQFEFFEKLYGDRIPVLAANRTEVIRKRALEIQTHLDSLNAQK